MVLCGNENAKEAIFLNAFGRHGYKAEASFGFGFMKPAFEGLGSGFGFRFLTFQKAGFGFLTFLQAWLWLRLLTSAKFVSVVAYSWLW